jgi:phosphopantothenoylcysteine decarboxylase/phosphopantothenate--cysteine ligase
MRNTAHDTAKTLLDEIEAFLARTGATPTKLGLAAVNDGHLVANLRNGHSITLKTADKVRAYMSRHGSRRRDGQSRGKGLHTVSHTGARAGDRGLPGRRIVLVIGGGIAAYKCLELIRRLRERLPVEVLTVLTRAAQEFVTPLSVGALSNAPVFTELFDLDAEREIGHIRLARDADLIVVAPATADLIARMAGGHADDLATSLLLATDRPVLVAPAMNPHMWLAPATRRNVALLEADGIHFVGPETGEMAERGEAGPGRLAEVPRLLEAIEDLLGVAGAPGQAGEGLLAGRHVLVTSGPTHEAIDPVRYIANRSSGKQGAAIAAEALRLGARVTLVTGPTSAAVPAGVDAVRVETAVEMLDAVRAALPADIAVFAAAVADWRVARAAPQKLKKQGQGGREAPRLELVENPDILKTIGHLPLGERPCLVIGFAAETENVIDNARGKRKAKGADWIVANDVSPATGVMGGDHNTVHIVTADGVESWPVLDKTEVARRLVERAADWIADNTTSA